MNSFKYEYINVNEIFNNITLIKDFSINQLSILIFIIILFIVFILLIFPYIYLYYKYIIKKLEKRKKTYLLKQIAIEKEIESEMQKEMEQH
jgi:hypothetical protein